MTTKLSYSAKNASLGTISIRKAGFAKQQGVALITVLLVLALAVVVATKMNSSLIFQVQRTENINSNQQAYWYAMGAEAFAKTVLLLSFKNSDDKKVTHLGQIWASGENAFPVDLGEISGEITDAQACLNLNAIINNSQSESNSSPNQGSGQTPNNNTGQQSSANNSGNSGSTNANKIDNIPKASLIELITNLEVDGISSFEAESMADSLYDWLDKDSVISGSGGAEDDDYAAKEYPYLAANSLLTSINELRLIEHFTPEVILTLKDYVCVLPNNAMHKININTLDEEDSKLLQALLGGIDENKAADILSERGEEGFKSIDDFYALAAVKDIKNFDQLREQFVIDSEFFTLTTKTSFNESYFSMKSIMKINKDESITVIDRSIGFDR